MVTPHTSCLGNGGRVFRLTERARSLDSRFTFSTAFRLTVAATVAGGLALAPALASASPAKQVTINGWAAGSSGRLQPTGGEITLTAVVTNAATCTYSVSPPVIGFPQTVNCAPLAGSSKRTQHVAVRLPANARSKSVHYTWTLLAKPSGSSASAKKSLTVTVEGYNWLAVQQTLVTKSLVTALSCPTTSLCVMVAGGGYAGTLNSTGSHWQKIDNSSSLLSVSCAPGAPVLCVAGDGAGNYLVLHGTKWSSPVAMPPAMGSGGVPDKVGKLGWTDCIRNGPKNNATVRTCIVGDDGGHSYLLTFGTTVSVRADAHPIKGIGGVACATNTACVVTDVNGNTIYFNGSNWSSPTKLDAHGDVSALSCAPHGTCMLTDHTGSVVTFTSNGSSSISHSVPGVNIELGLCVTGYCLLAGADGSFYQVVGDALARSPRSYGNLYGASVVGLSCAFDRPSPLLLSCTSIIQNAASSKKGKDFKGHVTLMK
jgi:hypothetical protein